MATFLVLKMKVLEVMKKASKETGQNFFPATNCYFLNTIIQAQINY